jgi:hypothetical protein
VNPPVCFFIPWTDWPPHLPPDPEAFWTWALDTEDGKYSYGRYTFPIRTCLELQAAGFPCELTHAPSPDAILITHGDFLPHTTGLEPWDRRPQFAPWLDESFIVSFQGDRRRHPYGNIRLVQNRADATGWLRHLGPAVTYMPHWSQPDLLARDPARGDALVNIAFLGHPGECDPSLTDPAWIADMRRLGFEFHVRASRHWHDYRDIDAVLAARSFDYKGRWLWKPPTKLFNAWLAGVPPILGRESAYTSERQSEFDYVEVTSRGEVEAALLRLRDDSAFRAAVVEQGQRRRQAVTAQALADWWRQLIEAELFPAYERWRRSSAPQRRAARWAGLSRTRAESLLHDLLLARHGSRDTFRHRKDWN